MDLVSKDRIFDKYQTRSTTSLQLHCNLILPDRAKLCWAKFSSDETICRAKFLSPKEKFVTFARRKISPNKSKSVFK